MTNPFAIAQRDAIQCVPRPDKANRHGLIASATGTGKTIALQTMAEGFSRIGAPVFRADIKGRTQSRLADPATAKEKAAAMAKSATSAIGREVGRQIIRGFSVASSAGKNNALQPPDSVHQFSRKDKSP
jgi:hypothetical protein